MNATRALRADLFARLNRGKVAHVFIQVPGVLAGFGTFCPKVSKCVSLRMNAKKLGFGTNVPMSTAYPP